jgi:hypothetical protein
MIMEAISSPETSVLTRATWHNILEYGILHSHRRNNPKSYIALTSKASSGEVMIPVRYELRLHIPEDGILYSDRREHLDSYKIKKYLIVPESFNMLARH